MTTPHLLGRPTNLNHEFTASPQDKSTRRGGVKFWIFWSPKMVHYTYSVKTIFVLFFFTNKEEVEGKEAFIPHSIPHFQAKHIFS